MRPLVPAILLAASVAWPAAGQTPLAQLCAQFGEQQYKRVDRAIDRVEAAEAPVPALQRFDGKVGSQSVAGAVTLRARVTYRDRRAALDTEFVCLLDARDQPLFFYAIPVLANRPSPTPLARGAAAQPKPAASLPVAGQQPKADEKAAAAPLTAPATSTATTTQRTPLRGLVRDTGGLRFSPCDGAPLALQDRTPGQELGRTLRELTGEQQGRPMFVEFFGERGAGSAETVEVLELRRAAVETAGCRERFDQREWIAYGNEPAWRLEVAAHDMMMIVPGSTPLPAPRYPHAGMQRRDRAIIYLAQNGGAFGVTIDEQRCVDAASGSLYAYRVTVVSEGKVYIGCGAHNPAMPVP
jgi:uncharacterized membrane protein